MGAHFQIGLYLKETFVPKAFLFFVNSPVLAEIKSGKRSHQQKLRQHEDNGAASKAALDLASQTSTVSASVRSSVSGSVSQRNGSGPTREVNEPAVVAAIDLAPPASQVSDEVA